MNYENVSAGTRFIALPAQENGLTGGFRVASIPEPRSLSQGATISVIALGVLLRHRRLQSN
jgi:hypothetical protein